jgi:hypothetical protein
MMQSVRVKTTLTLLAVLTALSAPGRATGLGLFGSHWDSRDAGASWGAGARLGFNVTKRLELELHGTYDPDFKDDSFAGRSLHLTAIPVDGGLRFNSMPDNSLNPFAGAGITY